jgi:hypothetical protein
LQKSPRGLKVLKTGEIMRLTRATSLFLILVLAGCTTPYKQSSIWDPNGYSEVFLDNSRAVITYTSTRGDRSEAVVRGVMLRAAELAKSRNFDGFVVLSDGGSESTSSFSTGGTYNATTIGGQTFGSITPGVPIIIARAQYRITVQFISGSKSVPNSLNADQVIAENAKLFK